MILFCKLHQEVYQTKLICKHKFISRNFNNGVIKFCEDDWGSAFSRLKFKINYQDKARFFKAAVIEYFLMNSL